MSKLIAIALLLIALTASVSACGSSTAAESQKQSSSPSASPSPKATTWPEMFAGKWVNKLHPVQKLVFRNDVGQASINRTPVKYGMDKKVFYGNKLLVMATIKEPPYQLESVGPQLFTGIYSLDRDTGDDITTVFISVKFSGRVLTFRHSENEPLGHIFYKEKYTLSADGEILLHYRYWKSYWQSGSRSTLFIRQ